MSSASNIPSPVLPVLDPTGRMSPIWFQFFLTLFSRTGGVRGAAVSDWMTDASAGAPQPDLTPIYGLIHAVEALAAQAMAATAQKSDERGEAGDGANLASLLGRLAELEARAEGGAAAAGPFDGSTTATASPGAGGAGALPATPAGYVTVPINGINRQIPYY